MVIGKSNGDCGGDTSLKMVFEISYVMQTSMLTASLMGSITILGKVINRETRGTVLTLLGLGSAIAYTVFIAETIHLYMWSYIITIIFYSLLTLIIFFAGVTGQIQI